MSSYWLRINKKKIRYSEQVKNFYYFLKKVISVYGKQCCYNRSQQSIISESICHIFHSALVTATLWCKIKTNTHESKSFLCNCETSLRGAKNPWFTASWAIFLLNPKVLSLMHIFLFWLIKKALANSSFQSCNHSYIVLSIGIVQALQNTGGSKILPELEFFLWVLLFYWSFLQKYQ